MKVVDALNAVSLLAFDTTPIIYFIEKNPSYIGLMRPIMQQIANGQITGIASVLALTEVLVHPIHSGNTTLVQQYETILTTSHNFRLVVIDNTVSRKAAELRASYNLKTPDALHIATAIVSKADTFLTNDKGLQRVSELNILLLDQLEL